MRTIAAAIMFAAVTVLTSAVHATTTFNVTEGSLTLLPRDTFASFSGDGFFVEMSSFRGFLFPGAFGSDILSVTIGLGADGGGTVQIGGTSCTNPAPPFNCGVITLTSPGLPLRPADWPSGENFIATAPFTAIGHLNTGDSFVGQGVLEGVICSPASSLLLCSISHGNGFLDGASLQYTFSVPEPPTLLLVVAALGVFGVLFGARFLRDRRPPKRAYLRPLMRLDRSFARLLLLLAVLALPQSALAARAIIVGNGTPESCTQTALQDALTAAGALGGGPIRFKCGTQPVTITLSEPAQLTIPDNTTVDGSGLITLVRSFVDAFVFVDRDTTVVLKGLSMTGFCGVLCQTAAVVNAGTLTIKDSTFVQLLLLDGVGAAIQNSGALTVKSSLFSQNFAEAGGAIFSFGTLTVENSTFSRNQCPEWGGAISSFGTLTIEKSAFSDNGCDNAGAIANFGSATIRNSTFSGNGSCCFMFGGGAIANAGGTLTIDNSTFSDNHSGLFGGGISSLGGTLTVENSLFIENSSGSIFDNRLDGLEGGAIASLGGTLTVKNSTFSHNSSNGSVGGGGIYVAGIITIDNSSFVGNTAASRGGGIANNGALTISNSTITQNTASVDGGGIYNFGGGTLTLLNTSVTDNAPNDIAP